MVMKRLRSGLVGSVAAVLLVGTPVAAQSVADLAAVFASVGDVSALISKAKAERKPDQPNFVQPVVKLPPYTLNLEYRMAGLNAPASVHEQEAEIFFVIDGMGTAVTGGVLQNAKRRNAENSSGTGIVVGEIRRVAKGDVLFVPENSPHWFSPSGGPLVLLSLHVPRPTK
jgi:mannose-6-phosphate isomerase-like protein (cupin superfamily)